MQFKNLDDQGILTLWNRTKSYINGRIESIDEKMDKVNPTGSGTLNIDGDGVFAKTYVNQTLIVGNEKQVNYDGKPGVAISEDGIVRIIKEDTPSIYFADCTGTIKGRIQTNTNGYMYFKNAGKYEFDQMIEAQGSIRTHSSLFTGGKTAYDDNVQGVYIGANGRIFLTGISSSPGILFYGDGQTTSGSTIVYNQSADHLQFNFATQYKFDNSIKNEGSVLAASSLCSGGKQSYSDGKPGVQIAASGNIHLLHETLPSVRFYTGGETAAFGRIDVNTNGHMLFKSATRYQFSAQIYSTTSTIATSDRNKKKDFKNLDDRYEKMFFDLKPQIYKFIDGTSNRYHAGFISQDVEESLFKNNLDSTEFAGYCKEIQTRVVKDTEEEYLEEKVYDENGNPVYDYMIRYEEFVPLNTHMIQKAYNKINSLESENKELKERIEKLEQALDL